MLKKFKNAVKIWWLRKIFVPLQWGRKVQRSALVSAQIHITPYIKTTQNKALQAHIIKLVGKL